MWHYHDTAVLGKTAVVPRIRAPWRHNSKSTQWNLDRVNYWCSWGSVEPISPLEQGEAKAQVDQEQTLKYQHKQVEHNTIARTQETEYMSGFSSSLRLAYLHVFDEATKAWVSRTLSGLFSSQEHKSLVLRVLTRCWMSYKLPRPPTRVGSFDGRHLAG
jgi:hypothetical protein